jgi:diguanylate cyclase (GGDEF)-like protein
MRISTTQYQNADSDRKQPQLAEVMAELDSLKKQSERLDLANKLHARMAGVLSLTGMIEAYSVWLMPLVDHELIGYSNGSRQKKHLFCSGHGPSRRSAMEFAEQLIEDNSSMVGTHVEKDGRFAYKWIFETSDDEGILLILKEGQELSDAEIDIVNYSLEILVECLNRGLEYEDLFEKASNDPLTGLSNRRVFEERIHAMMAGANRYNHSLSMISMDLDKFKAINDNLGHKAGDDVLIAVANVFKKAVRSTDLLVRMGGDEFLIVLDQTDRDSARILAERLCVAIDSLEIWANDTTKLGVSIGLSEMKSKERVQEWLERTDDILYHSKAKGRAMVSVD